MMRRSVIVAVLACLTACQYIPGTDEHAIVEAQEYVAANLKDPPSAQFRAAFVGESKVKDDTPSSMVCGEVNGKTSMGGYAGFSRFVASASGEKGAMIDPQVTATDADVAAADRLCRLAGEMGCQRSRLILEAIADQAGFNALWDQYCSTN